MSYLKSDRDKICMFIGASGDAVHTINMAKAHGIYVVALDGNAAAEGLKYADEAIVVDISDYDKVCEVVEDIKPDFCMTSPIGKLLTVTGYVNEKYGLPGVKYNAALWSTDKYLFHKRLNKAGLRNVWMQLVNKEVHISELNREYPAIMKPRFGSGSRDVYYITNDEELQCAYEKVINSGEDFILEQAVQGTEYGLDGAVINGELKLTLLRKKSMTPLPVRQAVASSSIVTKDTLERVASALKCVVASLEYDNCLLLADLIVNPEEVFVIEIAPRPSGHYIHDVYVPMIAGVDMGEEHLKHMLGEPSEFIAKAVRKTQIRYFDFEDVRVKSVPSLEDLKRLGACNILDWKCNIREGEVLNKVINGHSIMGRGYFIVEGVDEEDLTRQCSRVLSQFEVEAI